MDTSSIDQAYGQLQAEFQDVARSVQSLAGKLQAAAQSGDTNAREWLLDLKQVALDIKDEQIQVNALLQAIHRYADNSNQQLQQQAQQWSQPAGGRPFGGGGGGLFGGGGGRRGGLFGGLLGGGFGQAMEMGAGIALGEDVINDIF